MRINYKIIWFENEDWIKPAQRNLSNFLEEHGFHLEVRIEKDNSNVEALVRDIDNNLIDVDVIFMDYRLAQETRGDAIIQAIRNMELFTEILFYSFKTDVKKVIEEGIGTVEGIYYAERDNFLDKAKTVIWHSIKKTQEVNNMRGLIMAAVSDLDSKMLEIVKSFYERNIFSEESKKRVTEKLFEQVKIQVESKKKNFDKHLRTNRIDNLIKDNVMFDTSKKAYAMQCIIDEIESDDINHLKTGVFLNPYEVEVIGVRNNFAHIIEVIEEGVKKLKSRSTEEVFSDERCAEIRKNLTKHSDTIEIVRKLVCVVPEK